ncbi:matrixin family metalloprotease [Methanolapillus ohkumae]|uniref:Peptidase M10 metallopeptidase domain-containing protein n=1 Tax=Methanolapillus ohkumae TaxID=3028298 RepID=A0AA96ZV44_9EURY|nr:hypothetical protein MsAm2_02120 [Methanosarcinaceae archaeon Am2]
MRKMITVLFAILVISMTWGTASAYDITNDDNEIESWEDQPVQVDTTTMAFDWRSACNRSMDTWNGVGANFTYINKQNSSTNIVTIGKFNLSHTDWAAQETRTTGVIMPNGHREKTSSLIQINMNPNIIWSTSTTQNFSVADVQSVVLHELGHSLGLGHSEYSTAVMQGEYRADKRILTSDDIDGIIAIYGT